MNYFANKIGQYFAGMISHASRFEKAASLEACSAFRSPVIGNWF
jgi:hypothetical protein